jgi:hypothetical protein
VNRSYEDEKYSIKIGDNKKLLGRWGADAFGK